MSALNRLKGYPVPECIAEAYKINGIFETRDLWACAYLECVGLRSQFGGRGSVVLKLIRKLGYQSPDAHEFCLYFSMYDHGRWWAARFPFLPLPPAASLNGLSTSPPPIEQSKAASRAETDLYLPAAEETTRAQAESRLAAVS